MNKKQDKSNPMWYDDGAKPSGRRTEKVQDLGWRIIEMSIVSRIANDRQTCKD